MGHKVAQNEILKRVGIKSDFFFMVFRRQILAGLPGGLSGRARGAMATLPWLPEP